MPAGGNAAIYAMVPRSAAEARERLGNARTARLDSRTTLRRAYTGEVSMLYGTRAMWANPIVTWKPDGSIAVRPYTEQRPELRRIDAALPDEFRIDFRSSGRLRPRLTYRRVWHTTVQSFIFNADGSLTFGNRRGDEMTREYLDREVSRIEGFEPLIGRSGVPRLARPTFTRRNAPLIVGRPSAYETLMAALEPAPQDDWSAEELREWENLIADQAPTLNLEA